MDWLVAHFAVLVFYFVAAVAVVGAIGVVLLRSPVHAALSLLATFLAVAGLFVLERAEFIAAVQMLVYAGGVMVLFLFVIMLVNVRMLPAEPQYLRRLAPAALVIGTLLVVSVGAGVWSMAAGALAAPAPLTTVGGKILGNTEAVGWSLYRQYLLPFEVVSVVLLVAMIGAVVMGRKDEPPKEGA
jgi:NADH-quinone oxidoreductase subunit J